MNKNLNIRTVTLLMCYCLGFFPQCTSTKDYVDIETCNERQDLWGGGKLDSINWEERNAAIMISRLDTNNLFLFPNITLGISKNQLIQEKPVSLHPILKANKKSNPLSPISYSGYFDKSFYYLFSSDTLFRFNKQNQLVSFFKFDKIIDKKGRRYSVLIRNLLPSIVKVSKTEILLPVYSRQKDKYFSYIIYNLENGEYYFKHFDWTPFLTKAQTSGAQQIQPVQIDTSKIYLGFSHSNSFIIWDFLTDDIIQYNIKSDIFKDNQFLSFEKEKDFKSRAIKIMFYSGKCQFSSFDYKNKHLYRFLYRKVNIKGEDGLYNYTNRREVILQVVDLTTNSLLLERLLPSEQVRGLYLAETHGGYSTLFIYPPSSVQDPENQSTYFYQLKLNVQ